MNLQGFISKYQGKTKGYPTDNDYQGECLSIVKLYIKEVFNINPPPSGSNSAYGYWSNFPSPLNTVFKKVAYSPGLIPQPGDIPIWNTKVGNGYGHIDVVVDAGRNNFTGFDQNWGGRHAHLVTHDYSNIVGWLTPIQEEPMSKLLTYLGMESEEAAIARLDEHLGTKDSKCDWGAMEDGRGGHLGSARRRVKELESQPVASPSEPPVIPGWKNNGLQITVGSQTWNYEKA